jgi:hypothetical protein
MVQTLFRSIRICKIKTRKSFTILAFWPVSTGPWKRVIIHFAVFAFFMTWLVVLDRFVGLGGDIVGIVAVIWGPLLAYHAISALNGMGNEPIKGVDEDTSDKARGKT